RERTHRGVGVRTDAFEFSRDGSPVAHHAPGDGGCGFAAQTAVVSFGTSLFGAHVLLCLDRRNRRTEHLPAASLAGGWHLRHTPGRALPGRGRKPVGVSGY